MMLAHYNPSFKPPPGLLAARALETLGTAIARSERVARPLDGVARPQRYLIARRPDGNAAWIGFFRTRAQSERFLKALGSGTLPLQPSLWDLPTPCWAPGIGGDVTYEFSTTVTATGAGSASAPASTYAVGLEAYAGGGAGGGHNKAGSGGAGGGYAGLLLLSFTSGSTLHWSVGATTAGSINVGATGTNSWLNISATSQPTSIANGLYATGGTGGDAITNTVGGTGGTYGPTGATGKNGGNGGGNSSQVSPGGGGGGGGGPTGAGTAGAASPTGTGGAGGPPDGGAGGNAGTSSNAGAAPSGGGGGNWASGSGGTGAAGMVRYTFYISATFGFNLAMLGM